MRTYKLDYELPKLDITGLPVAVAAEDRKPQVEIRPLSKTTYGLWPNRVRRNSAWLRDGFGRYNPMTRGYLHFDKEKMKLQLRVYINWVSLPFFIAWFVIIIFAAALCFRMFLIAFGTLAFAQILWGEIQQYLRCWEVVKRYMDDEIDIYDVDILLSGKPFEKLKFG